MAKKWMNKTHKYYLLAIDQIGILNRDIIIRPELIILAILVIPRSQYSCWIVGKRGLICNF